MNCSGRAGHDVVVAVEDERRPVLRPDLGGQGEHVPVLVVGDRDVARLQPALDEPGGGAQTLDVGRVVGDETLGEQPFVHPAEGSGAVLRNLSPRLIAITGRSCSYPDHRVPIEGGRSVKHWLGAAVISAAMLLVPSSAMAGNDDPALLKFQVPSEDQYDDFEALGLDMNHQVDKNADGSITVQAWVTDQQLAWVRAQGYPNVGVVHDKYNIDHIRSERDADIASR